MSKKYADYGMPKDVDDTYYDSGFKGGSQKAFTSCYHDHPVLKIGGGTLYGGSCISPVIKTADLYIGFDHGMRPQQYAPWDRKVEQVYFPIDDMQAPDNAERFKKLVEYTRNQLQEGKVVHAGCIGGHGRTGTFFAALFQTITGDLDAITTVRKLYCKKAVESSSQIKFLAKHFGIAEVEGTKVHYTGKGKGGVSYSSAFDNSYWPKSGASEIKKSSKPVGFANATKVWNHVNSPSKIQGVLF